MLCHAICRAFCSVIGAAVIEGTHLEPVKSNDGARIQYVFEMGTGQRVFVDQTPIKALCFAQ